MARPQQPALRRGSQRAALNDASVLDISPSAGSLLDLVRRHGPIARADLAERTTLSQQSIHRIGERLVSQGLVRLLPAETRGPGKPSPRLILDPDGAFGIGITVNSDSVLLSVANLVGEMLYHETMDVDANAPTSVVDASIRIIANVLDALALPRERVAGIGVSMQGFRRSPGAAFTTPVPLEAWSDLDVPSTFGQPLGFQVSAENDATLGAIAELWVGAGRHYQDFAFLSFKYGFGGGLILRGAPYLGHFMNAAEISATYDSSELERRPGLSSLLRMLNEDGIRITTIQEFNRRYDASWPTIDRWIDSVSPALNRVLRAIMAIVDPGAIVFGGQAPIDLRRRLMAVADRRAPDRLGRELPSPELLVSNVTDDASALGAAILPIRTRLFTPN